MKVLDFIRLFGRNRVVHRFVYGNFDFVIKRKSFLPRFEEKNSSKPLPKEILENDESRNIAFEDILNDRKPKVTIEDVIKMISVPTRFTDETSYQETAIRVAVVNTQLRDFILQVEYVRFSFTYKGFNLVSKINPGNDNGIKLLSKTRQESLQIIHSVLESLDELLLVTEATSRGELIAILAYINKNAHYAFLEIDTPIKGEFEPDV